MHYIHFMSKKYLIEIVEGKGILVCVLDYILCILHKHIKNAISPSAYKICSGTV